MVSSSRIMLFRALRSAALAGTCVILSGCGSINIPLGSLLGSSKTDVAATDPSLTAPPAPVAAVTSTSLATPSTPDTVKTASTGNDKTFSLEAAGGDVTGSLGDAASPGFGKDDHAAVLGVLSTALPEKGTAASTPWANDSTGATGMVVPMASLTKGDSSGCRDLLISYGKGSHKEWYKAEGCRKAGKWQLSDVSPWRKTK